MQAAWNCEKSVNGKSVPIRNLPHERPNQNRPSRRNGRPLSQIPELGPENDLFHDRPAAE